MQYLPRIVGVWDETSPEALARFSDEDLSLALQPLGDLLTKLPLPITREGLEGFLSILPAWIIENRHPLPTPNVSLGGLDIAIYEGNQMLPDKLLVAAEVDTEGWRINHCIL
jgi:hypothetical protein